MSQALTHTLTPDAKAALDAGDVDALMALSRARYGGITMELDSSEDSGDQDDQDDSNADDQDDQDQDDDGDDKDPRVQRANRQAANYRTQLRETEQRAEQAETAAQQATQVVEALRNALDPNGDSNGEGDPAEQVQQLTGQVEQLTSTNTQLEAALLVHNIAADGEVDANPTALLDSRSFADALAKLDAGAEDYRTQVQEAMQDAVSKNAAYRAGQGSSRGGSELDKDNREQQTKRPKGLGAAIGSHYGS